MYQRTGPANREAPVFLNFITGICIVKNKNLFPLASQSHIVKSQRILYTNDIWRLQGQDAFLPLELYGIRKA